MIYRMTRFLLILICATVTQFSLAQEAPPGKVTDRSDLATVLGFEVQPSGGMPGGWGERSTWNNFRRRQHCPRWLVVSSNRTQCRQSEQLLHNTKSIPIDLSGKEVELRGFLRTEDVSDFGGLCLPSQEARGSLRCDWGH
jgi:hypothetical protein